MSAEELLLTAAEVGITLTGFTGIVAVLGHRGRDRWSSPEWLRLLMLLVLSLAAVFFSFAPGVLELLGASSRAAWAVSSAALALFMVGIFAWVVLRVSQLGPEASAEFPRRIGAAILACSTPIVAVLALNAVGVRFQQESGPFVLGVVWLLVLGAFQFLRLLRLPLE